MHAGSISVRVAVRHVVLDLVLNLAVPVTYFRITHIEEPARLLPIYALIIPLRMAISLATLLTLLRPIDAWEERAEAASAEERGRLVAQAVRAVRIAPGRFAMLQAFFWSIEHVGITLFLLHVAPSLCPIDPRALETNILSALGLALGAWTLYYPFVSVLLSDTAERVFRAADRSALPARGRSSLRTRILVLALGLVGAPTLSLTSLGYSTEIDAGAEKTAWQAERRTVELGRRLAARLAQGSEPGADELDALLRAGDPGATRAFVVDRDGRVLAGAAALTEAPALRAWLLDEAARSDAGTHSEAARTHVLSFERVGSRHVVGALARAPSSVPLGLAITYAATLLVMLIWAPLCALFAAGLLAAPINRITAAARRIVEEGKLDEIERTIVPQSDELGSLADQFNALLELFQGLSRSASEVAGGSLDVTIEGRGDLPDAFRSMVGSLQSLVGEIRETAARLALAAAEIHRAAREQESAATSQSAATIEIARTMDALSHAAAHVTDTARGVHRDAERTLQTTDTVVARITDLTALANRIGELQEVIGEIANRSDLLALNGSLEASHAGAAGRGFALLAAEMRRLAERVSSSTQTARELVTSIRSAGGATVAVTRESRALAESTTEAARQITLVAQQQRTGTEQVSQSIQDIALVLSAAAAATTQTRAAAEELKLQAERLTVRVKRFQEKIVP